MVGVQRTGGGSDCFYFPLPAPRTNLFCCCQTLDIIVVIVMLDVAVVYVAIVGLATLASITTLALYLIPLTIGSQAVSPHPISLLA